MRYTALGNTGLKASVLGFGCMRLPEKDGRVLREPSTPLLRRAVDLGINYFDTAIDYCHGDSQAALGEALEGLRSKVIISAKNHFHRVEKDEWRRHLEHSLEFLRTDYIDIYSHHGISWKIFTRYLNPDTGGLTAEMMRAKEEGLIRHLGFSFHDKPANLIKLVDTGHYEIVTLQYNLLDQTNKDALLYAHERGMGVVIMGPVGGGRLGLPSRTIAELVGDDVSSTPEAALRFVWGTPGVDVALSGMEHIEMLEENARVAEKCEPFSEKSIKALNLMVEERKKKSGLYCTGCGYCEPECPNRIAIHENLDLLNLADIYDLHDIARERYQRLKTKASECVDCGRCVVVCPQQIDIPNQLKRAAMLFDENAGALQCETAVDGIDPDGRFTLNLDVFNFSDEKRSITAKLQPGEGITLNPKVLEIESFLGFARLRRKVEGCMAPGRERISFSVEITDNGVTTKFEKNYSLLLAYKGTADDWDSGEWHGFIPSEIDFVERQDTLRLHAVRFKLSYDEKNLLLFAEVKDDFLFPTMRKNHHGDVGDCLEIFLDGSRHTVTGGRGYGRNIRRIILYPGTPGKAPPFYKAPRTDTGVKLQAEKTALGYRLNAAIPFSSVASGASPPRKIGFDLACHTSNENGARIGTFTWTGNRNNNNDASNLSELWLI